MGTIPRRLGMAATMVAIALSALPAMASADCTPACGEAVEQGLDAIGVGLLVATLSGFVAVMAVGSRVGRRDRRSGD